MGLVKCGSMGATSSCNVEYKEQPRRFPFQIIRKSESAPCLPSSGKAASHGQTLRSNDSKLLARVTRPTGASLLDKPAVPPVVESANPQALCATGSSPAREFHTGEQVTRGARRGSFTVFVCGPPSRSSLAATFLALQKRLLGRRFSYWGLRRDHRASLRLRLD